MVAGKKKPLWMRWAPQWLKSPTIQEPIALDELYTKYPVTGHLGQGGHGSVGMGTRAVDGLPVAVKAVPLATVEEYSSFVNVSSYCYW